MIKRSVIRGSQVFLGVAILLGISPGRSQAQSGSSQKDSLRTYELSEIVVGSSVPGRTREPIKRVNIAAIVREDAPSAASLVKLVPSAHLQTNSRGESLIYIRGSGERQVAVFFDGALLNIPWDYRVDMSLIPSGMLGGMAVSRGVPSVIYGTNVIGGAVNLQSRSMEGSGSHAEATLQTGSNNSNMVRSTYLKRTPKWSAVVSGGHYSTDGHTVPSHADLSFNQPSSDIRTNTDRRISNIFGRVSKLGDDNSELGVSLLHVDSQKGIAPEGHVDPLVERVRFWRYPSWRNTMLIANARSAVSSHGQLRATVWLGQFEQKIEQFEDATYSALTDVQEDNDFTVGFRIVGSRRIGAGNVRASINWLTSRHEQFDSEIPSGEPQSEGTSGQESQTFRQHLFSTGLEMEIPVLNKLVATAGVSLDGNATPLTGDKPDRDTDFAAGVTGAVVFNAGEDRSIRISAGRKVRFPTMRELFGEALQRFVVNPSLKPETSLQVDARFEQVGETLSGEIVLFYQRAFDTIDQINLDISGDRKRQRINLDGSRVVGIEVGGTVGIWEGLSATGHLSWMNPEAFDGGQTRKLVEKPEMLSSITILMNTRWGGSFQVNVRHIGTAYGLDSSNTEVSLSPATELNARIALRRYFPTGGVFVEIYGGANNITDETTLPQLGLPGIGREFRLGASISF